MPLGDALTYQCRLKFRSFKLNLTGVRCMQAGRQTQVPRKSLDLILAVIPRSYGSRMWYNLCSRTHFLPASCPRVSLHSESRIPQNVAILVGWHFTLSLQRQENKEKQTEDKSLFYFKSLSPTSFSLLTRPPHLHLIITLSSNCCCLVPPLQKSYCEDFTGASFGGPWGMMPSVPSSYLQLLLFSPLALFLWFRSTWPDRGKRWETGCLCVLFYEGLPDLAIEGSVHFNPLGFSFF